MLVREGDDRNDTIDRRLASFLAAIAGALNAAAFSAVGFFSANMTGNVSTISDHIAFGHWATSLFYLSILLAFILGACVSALVINAGRRRRIQTIYAYVVLTEAVLLACLGASELWLLQGWRLPVLVLGLAFLMGLQNAVVTRISGARIRTTHVSGMATDIGIELAAALDMLLGRETAGQSAQNWGRLRLHATTVLSFLVGGVVGVVIYRAFGEYLLIASAAALLLVASEGILRSRRSEARSPSMSSRQRARYSR